MLALRDDGAEDELRGAVTLVPIKSFRASVDKPPCASLFQFKHMQSRDAILLYWAVRLMTVQLCLVLSRVSENVAGAAGLRLSVAQLENELESLLLSVLMCWHDGFGAVNVYMILWSALTGKDHVRGLSAQRIRDWILHSQNQQLAGWAITYRSEQADVDADVLVRGPLHGTHVDTILGNTAVQGVESEVMRDLRDSQHLTGTIQHRGLGTCLQVRQPVRVFVVQRRILVPLVGSSIAKDALAV